MFIFDVLCALAVSKFITEKGLIFLAILTLITVTRVSLKLKDFLAIYSMILMEEIEDENNDMEGK